MKGIETRLLFNPDNQFDIRVRIKMPLHRPRSASGGDEGIET
jgi:hypothetical protein